MNVEGASAAIALWLLLRPAIEAKAQELGATPQDVALALTLGAPEFVVLSAPAGEAENHAEGALAIFRNCCVALIMENV
jgi:hypothetical protein